MVAVTHQEVRKVYLSATSTGARRFDEDIAWLQSMSIDGGLGSIADITGLALFLVSPEARWMTGTTSFINGGIVSPIN